MFQTERFIEDCRAVLRANSTQAAVQAAVQELVSRAVREPAPLMRAVGEPVRAGVNVIHKADDLTILNLCWGPRMDFHPHDHHMWAVIGIYAGREDNAFYRREGQGLKQHGTKVLNAGDVTLLGKEIIHSVINPLDQITAAIHVYGGDFFATPRSEWDPASFEERPYDVAHTMRKFEASNVRLG